MARSRKTLAKKTAPANLAGYDELFADVAQVIEEARRSAARSVNTVMTATYWLVGRRIVEAEQAGRARAQYGKELIERLSADLSARFGRGFGRSNLFQIRAFYVARRDILQTASGESSPRGLPEKVQTPSGQLAVSTGLSEVAACFPLPWSHYVRLLAVKNENARAFYEDEALRGGWTIRQLDRQIQSQFYERTALSRNKAAMLTKGARARPEDRMPPEEEIKDPYVLEFLGLKDEYSETDLEAALIAKLEAFLLELGGDFTFVGRQRRLRVGDAWYRIDLLFFHRRLRCLVIIDLKIGKFTHADAGQMHLYLNYAREHWTLPDENPPVGLILCAEQDHAVAKYALEGLPNKVLATEYRTALPKERLLVEAIETTKRQLETRAMAKPKPTRQRKPRGKRS
jgi:predicted nuclease of restriction endonuclease-like (RecB) superfamily